MSKCNLKTLLLNSNKIENEGLFSIAILLSNQKIELQTLHLGENVFSYEGVKLLCESLESNITLKTLYLNDNELDELSIYAITKAIF